MTDISVRTVHEGSDGTLFEVVLSDGDGSSTQHRIIVPSDDLSTLTKGDVTGEELVRRSVAFLLEREPKESILREFDIMTIARYFPEYPDALDL